MIPVAAGVTGVVAGLFGVGARSNVNISTLTPSGMIRVPGLNSPRMSGPS